MEFFEIMNENYLVWLNKKYLYYWGVKRSTLRDGGWVGAWTPAEVCVVACRLQDPVSPPDFLKVDAQILSAALFDAWRAVDAAPHSLRLQKNKEIWLNA